MIFFKQNQLKMDLKTKKKINNEEIHTFRSIFKVTR